MSILDRAKKAISGHGGGPVSSLVSLYRCPDCAKTFPSADSIDTVECGACGTENVELSEGAE